MRLRRLDLTRYGKFTGHSIDFGASVPGEPDLHVLYGQNEAGKSTMLSAFLDLLFGIETRSGYDFIHPYATMRIGAALDLGGDSRDFARIKRPQNSLLDEKDQPVAATAILGNLGGIDREAYRTMFSLDDDTLEAGGESILASKGDLGQLLFSASAGLVDLSNGLDDLRAEADRFYKFKARSGELADLKKQLAELKADRERIDTLASDYVRLVQDRDRTAALYDETVVGRSRVQGRIDEIQRQVNALPRLAALRGLRERLAPLDDCPEAPPGWDEDVAALQKEAIELDVGGQAIAREIDHATARIEAIAVDEGALRLGQRMEACAPLRARHVTADKDLPDRRLRLRDAESAIARLLQRLEKDGEPAPRRLVLGASVTGRLRQLIETRSGIDAAVMSATKELAAARGRLETACATLRDTGGDAGPARDGEAASASLAATVGAIRMEDFTARGRLAERAGDAAKLKLGDRLRELRPWQGEVDELIDLRVPHPDTIARWKTAMADAQKRIERHAGDIERLTTERRRHEAERQAIGAVPGLVTDEDTRRIRIVRDEAWADHRRRLDPGSADSFEAALRRDDAVTIGRFGRMAELAKLNQASRAVAIAKAEGERAIELKDAATAALQGVEDDMAQGLETLSPALKGMTPPQLEAWLHKRDQALQARELLWATERDRRDAHTDAAAARDRLASALAAAGSPQDPQAGLDRLQAAAQAAVDRQTRRGAMLAAVDEHRRDVDRRERDLAAAGAGDRDWAEAWAKTCAACWLGEGGAPPSLATVREILPVLAELGPALETRAGLADRIDKMEQDQAAFQNEIAALAADAGISRMGISVLAMARMIDERVEAARAGRVLHDSESQKLDGLHDRQRALAARVAVHQRRAAEITAYFGVESLAEGARALAGAEKRAELQRQAGEATRDILDALRLTTLEEAERMLDSVDRAQLDLELAELKTRFDDVDQRRLELFLTHSHAIDRVEAIGGDAKVAEIEERRRTVLLEIEEGALRYLRLRAGTVATEWALRAYRDSHRSSMLAEASQAFRTISRGAYSGLAAQPDKDGETLIALAAAGGSKEARELSKGTRFQLYLALRVAGYHEFARARRPVPFIADDIMETFDDFRAEEAFRLFAGMAGKGQVIYLTHHRHLCDIARAVCPGTRIHELSSGRA